LFWRLIALSLRLLVEVEDTKGADLDLDPPPTDLGVDDGDDADNDDDDDDDETQPCMTGNRDDEGYRIRFHALTPDTIMYDKVYDPKRLSLPSFS
jgi:hypothetical protein